MTRANSFAGWGLVALVLLSPIPFGSNRPFFWAFWACVIGVAAAIYFGLALSSKASLRVPPRALLWPALLWAGGCIWLVAQMLPLRPFAVVAASGFVFESNTISLAPGATALMLLRWISYALVFFLAVEAGANERRSRRLVAAVFWIVVAHAAFGLIQLNQLSDTILGFEKSFYSGSATGTFVNRNSFATFLAMGLVLGAAQTILSGEANRNASAILPKMVLGMAGLAVIGLALLATESRMGLVAALFGAGIVLLLTIRSVRYAPLLLLIFAVIAGLLVWLFGQGLLERVLELAGAANGRLELYHQVIEMIGARPWLGYGGGSFELAFPLFAGPPLPLDLVYDRAHSTYLTLLVELGVIVGLFPVGALMLIGFGTLSTALAGRALAPIAAIGVMGVVALHSTVDFSLEIEANAFAFAVIAGLGFTKNQRRH